MVELDVQIISGNPWPLTASLHDSFPAIEIQSNDAFRSFFRPMAFQAM